MSLHNRYYKMEDEVQDVNHQERQKPEVRTSGLALAIVTADKCFSITSGVLQSREMYPLEGDNLIKPNAWNLHRPLL